MRLGDMIFEVVWTAKNEANGSDVLEYLRYS
jgi:hypothetical protein